MNFPPLLSKIEISSLMSAAPETNIGRSTRKQRSGRPGGLTAEVRGSGMDFAELRPYQPGDDPRSIDWRATARVTHPLVRTFNTDLSRPMYFLIDRRASMRFGTRRRLKVTQALRAALWLGGREARSGHEIAGVILDSPCIWVPRQQSMTALRRIADAANAPCPPIEPGDAEPDWKTVLSGLQQRLPRNCTLVMFSDFIGIEKQHVRLLRSLGQHCETFAIGIYDPAEISGHLPGGLEYRWGQQVMRTGTGSSKLAERLVIMQQKHSDFLAREFARADMIYERLASDLDTLEEVLQ